MKPPKDVWDKTPLQYEPFLSGFAVRKLAGSRRGDNWFAPLAKAIHDDPKQRPAAVQWSKLAFAPEGTAKKSKASNPRPTPKQLLAHIELFVRFYWELSNDNEKGALDVVNGERKIRNFGYLLLPPRARRAPQPTQAEKTTQPHHPDAPHGSGSAPCRSGGSRGTRASRKSREGKVGEAGGDSGKAKHAADGSNSAAVAGGTGGIKVTAQCGGDDVAICEPSSAMDFPEEDKGVVVFRGDFDVAAFVADHSQPHDDPSPTGTVAICVESSDDHTIDISPTAASRATPSDISMTTAVEVSDPAPEEPPVPSKKQRRKKARNDAPQEPTRQRQPRAAANEGRLSQLAKGEHQYHSKAKRGLVDDLEDLTPTPGVGQQSASAPPATHRAKKSKLRTPSEDHDDPMSAVTEEEPDHVSSVCASLRPPRSKAMPAMSTEKGPSPGPTSNPSRRKKRDAPQKERKIKGIDTSARPSKRQRGKHSEANPTETSSDTSSQEERRRKNPSTAYRRVDGGPPVSSPLGSANGLEREPASHHLLGQGVTSTTSSLDANPMVSELPRTVKPLRPQGVRGGLPGLGAPIAAPARLGIPHDLAEMNRILCDTAAGARMILSNTATTMDEWTPDLDAQDAPPDSDDEEEIPLSQIASLRREVRDEGANVSTCATDILNGAGIAEEPPTLDEMSFALDDSIHLDACPWRSCVRPSSADTAASPAPPLPPSLVSTSQSPLPSTLSPLPPVISNPVGTRVPRPIPPPAPQKKPLKAHPTIWAKSRQEVCESFDWFRSYQSGVYHANNLVRGYLLSAFSASRDVFARDGRLIISHGGGKAESLHSSKGQATLQKAADQEEGDKSVRALLQTYKMKLPVALLIDDRYALFPYDLTSKPDCTYVVLGFYHIAHAWAERQPADNNTGFVTRYKFAFVWCDKQPKPWWIERDKFASLATSPREDSPTAQYDRCASCHALSPLVYEQGWMCLRSSCTAFWTLLDSGQPPQDLTYSDAFLNASYRCDHENLEDIAPQPPAAQATNGVVTSRRFTKGWHCKKCGRLSCRYKWQHWECQSCGSALQVIGKSRFPNEFWSQRNPGGFLHHKVADGSGIQVSQLLPYRVGNSVGNYHVYVLPQNRGRIYLILGGPTINQLANEIFQDYQNQAVSGELQFRRWPLRSHQCRGELLTNYFSQNTGEPYQYVGGTANTIPFDDAPSAVVKARELIQSRMMSVMQAENQPYRFNEVLSAAYMEEQRMAFHSDAENGLGPRVASLSLGSAAHMYFRPLKKYRKESGGGHKCDVLTLFLKHGDVLIMDGAEVQEYYEHTVVPLNFRIAATARYINNRNH